MKKSTKIILVVLIAAVTVFVLLYALKGSGKGTQETEQPKQNNGLFKEKDDPNIDPGDFSSHKETDGENNGDGIVNFGKITR